MKRNFITSRNVLLLVKIDGFRPLKNFLLSFYRVFCNRFLLFVRFDFIVSLWETLFAKKGFIYEMEFSDFRKGFVIS